MNSKGDFKSQVKGWIAFINQRLRIPQILKIFPYFIAALITGLISVVYANAFELAQDFGYKIHATQPYLLLLVTPMLFALGWFLVTFLGPGASGSGIPQVMATLELDLDTDKKFIDKLIGLKIAFVKFFSSLLCIMGGGAIGREGPTIQISAIIFYTFGKRFQTLKTAVQHHSWIIAGAAAGLAAAFNTPLGGLVFAIEELTTPHFRRLKTTLISAVIISGFVAQAIQGPYLYFGLPKTSPPTWHFIYYAAVIGLIAGLLGGLFGTILSKSLRILRRLDSKWRLMIVIFCGLIVSSLSLFLGEVVLGSGSDLVRKLIFESDVPGSWDLVVGRYLNTLISYLAGCGGGIFAPSLAIGASIGSAMSQIFGSENSNLLILLGMTAFLAGVTDAPFTSFVLVIEMTDRHSAIFPIMVAAIAAATVSRLVAKESFYRSQTQFYLSWLHSVERKDDDKKLQTDVEVTEIVKNKT